MQDNSVFKIPSFDGSFINGVFRIGGEEAKALCGLIVDETKQPVKQAAACLYKWNVDGGLEPVACTFSDEGGRFLLGPLSGDDTYYVKVDMCVSCEFSPDILGERYKERDSPERYEKYKDVYGE